MATRRVTTIETDPESDELAPDKEAKTAEERTTEEELQLALSEIGESGAKVQVVKTLPASEAGNCTSYAGSEFSIDRVRDEWGGGTYMLYFRLPNGTLKTKRSISILAKKAPPTPTDRTAEIIAALKESKTDTSGGTLGLILPLIMKQQEESTKILVAMIQAQGNAKAQGMGPTELVALMGAIQGLSGKGSGDKGGSSLDELVKVLKVAKELGGDGEGGGIFDKLALMAAPLLEKLAEKNNAPQNPLARPPVPVSATIVRDSKTSVSASVHSAHAPNESAVGAGDTTGAEIPPEDESMNLRLIGWLRETLGLLLKQAAKDSDPELYADYVLDNLPEGITADVVLAQLQATDVMDKLQFFDSRAGQYIPWLEDFRAAVIERIQEAQEEAAREKARAERRANSPPDPEAFHRAVTEAAPGNEASGDGM